MIVSVYFTSDLHLGHRLASEKRGFKSIDEHDAAVIESILSVDNKRAMIWVLGDVAMKKESLNKLSVLKSRLKMVMGNHDQYELSLYLNYFAEVKGFLKYKNLWLSHCPIHPQEMYRCKANVHGHIHKGTESDELEYPYINVNWDFWQRPVSINEIKEMIVNANPELLNEA